MWICVEKKNQLDATERFIALIICSTCFGQFYAHHQELETICVCYYHLWCAVLGCWLLGVRCRAAGHASRKRDVAHVHISENRNLPIHRRSSCDVRTEFVNKYGKTSVLQKIHSNIRDPMIIFGWMENGNNCLKYALGSTQKYAFHLDVTSWNKYQITNKITIHNSEINPTRCNNCVYSSQWLYSTCFG